MDEGVGFSQGDSPPWHIGGGLVHHANAVNDGHTLRQRVQPVQSEVTWGRWVSGSKVIAWYPESLQTM